MTLSPLPEETVALRVELAVAGAKVSANVRVPTGPTRPVRMLPVFRTLTHAIVDEAVRAVERGGQRVSCKAGCGACCRQLVPITETEAYHLRELVDAFPEPRRAAVLARFEDARRRLDEAGQLEAMLGWEKLDDDELEVLGLAYFKAGVSCPFLEDESCSIHAERPIACREFLVTSPAEHCSDPTPETVLAVPLAGYPSNALARIDGGPPSRNMWWLPLVHALEWDAAHEDAGVLREGKAILDDFLALLVHTGASAPAETKSARRKSDERKRRKKRK